LLSRIAIAAIKTTPDIEVQYFQCACKRRFSQAFSHFRQAIDSRISGLGLKGYEFGGSVVPAKIISLILAIYTERL
jgi:3-dehydroquinate dehydratase